MDALGRCDIRAKFLSQCRDSVINDILLILEVSMNIKNHQAGLAMWETCLHITVFLFVITVALKLGPLYIDDMNIGSAIKGMHQGLEGKDIYELPVGDIKNALSKNFQVSMISTDVLKNLDIEKTGNKVILRLDYDAKNSFMGNVDVVVHFSHEVDLAEPAKK